MNENVRRQESLRDVSMKEEVEHEEDILKLYLLSTATTDKSHIAKTYNNRRPQGHFQILGIFDILKLKANNCLRLLKE